MVGTRHVASADDKSLVSIVIKVIQTVGRDMSRPYRGVDIALILRRLCCFARGRRIGIRLSIGIFHSSFLIFNLISYLCTHYATNQTIPTY